MSRSPRAPEVSATMLRTARPIRVKAKPKPSICKPGVPAPGSTNCGRKARKNKATFGLSTFESTPCQKANGSLVRSARSGAEITLPVQHGSDAQVEQVGRAGVLHNRKCQGALGEGSPRAPRRRAPCAPAGPSRPRRPRPARRPDPARRRGRGRESHVRPGHDDERQRSGHEEQQVLCPASAHSSRGSRLSVVDWSL